MATEAEREYSRRRAEWLKEQGWEVLQATQLNTQLRDAIRLSSDDISDALVTAVQARIWEKGIGHFSDSPDRCKVNHAGTMQEWVEADWGLGMTMSQLFRAVANKRMNSSAVEATTLLIEATPRDVLETVACAAPEGDLLSKPVPGWRDIIRANEDAYGPEWRKAAAALDDLLHRKQGETQARDESGRFEPVGGDTTERPDRKSREGRRRTLKRYADDPKLCADKGVEQSSVQQALRAFEEGELSAAAAMRACGLLAQSDSSINRVFLVRDSQEVARRLIAAAGVERAAEIAAALNTLIKETK
jgi:hypothetical protein